jgi:hypothetical protein
MLELGLSLPLEGNSNAAGPLPQHSGKGHPVTAGRVARLSGIFATTSGLRGNRLYVGMLGKNH